VSTVEITGDMLEGGGQIIRTSLALAALLGKDVRLTKIRDKRPNPGLQAQHVTAVKALGVICDADTEGVLLGSRELVFKPRRHIGGKFSFDVGTAGSIPLILQALMPSAAFAPSPLEMHLTGGTDVRWSPTIDYLRMVVVPVLSILGYKAQVNLLRRGHYPKGGGEVAMTINPIRSLKAVRLIEPPSSSGIEGISHCVRLPSHVAQRQAATAMEKLSGAGYKDVNIVLETYPPDHDPHFAPGSGITLFRKTEAGSIIGADSVGERGKPAERVGEEAATRLLAEINSNAPIDRHLGDILIPYMVVAEGRSEIVVSEITMHTMTNIRVAEMMADVRFDVGGQIGETGAVKVQGIGLGST
jgi:RNA 3'-terminal phosphate cyclase (ATP)